MGLKRIIKNLICKRPIKHNRILFESNGPYDNAYTMFLYACKNRKDLNSYFYCPSFFIDGKNIDKKKYKFSKRKNHFLEKIKDIRFTKFLYTCETIFTSYYLIRNPNKETKLVYVGHGNGIKLVSKYFNMVYSSGCDIVLPSNDIAAVFKSVYQINNNKIILNGNPRCDDLCFLDELDKKFKKTIKWNDDEIVILVMITFRRNANGTFNKDIIFPEFVDFDKLNNDLKQLNVKFVIKFHHVLDNVDVSPMTGYSNIVPLKNIDLFKIGLNPTTVLMYSDALLTDYSSVTTDYVLLNKQIGFLTDDIDAFTGVNQGFIVDDPLDLLPGTHIYNYSDLIKFVKAVVDRNDLYKEKRAKVSMFFNGYTKNNHQNSASLLDYYYPKK